MLLFLEILSYGLIFSSSGFTLAVLLYYLVMRIKAARRKLAAADRLQSVSIINIASEERKWTEDSIRSMFVTLYGGDVEVVFSTKDMDLPYVSTAMNVSLKFPQTGMVLNEFHPPPHQFEKASLEVSGARVAQNDLLVFVEPDMVLDSSHIGEMVSAVSCGSTAVAIPAGFRALESQLSSAFSFVLNGSPLNPKFSFYASFGASPSNKIIAVSKTLYNELIEKNPDSLNRYSSLEALTFVESNPYGITLLEKGAKKFLKVESLKDFFNGLKFEALKVAGGRRALLHLLMLSACGIPASFFSILVLKMPLAVCLLPFAVRGAALATPLFNSMKKGERFVALLLSPLIDTLVFLVSIYSLMKPTVEIYGRRYSIKNSLLFPER